MGFLDSITRAFQALGEWTSKDEIVFGEVVRMFVKQGYPVVQFHAGEGKQSARFLIKNEVLHTFTVTIDKKIGATSVMNVVAEVRNELADPDDMIAMFKTDLSNIAKIPLFGQIRVNHEYNSVFASTSTIKSLNTYLGSKVGEVDATQLQKDLQEMLDRLTQELRRFKKHQNG